MISCVVLKCIMSYYIVSSIVLHMYETCIYIYIHLFVDIDIYMYIYIFIFIMIMMIIMITIFTSA